MASLPQRVCPQMWLSLVGPGVVETNKSASPERHVRETKSCGERSEVVEKDTFAYGIRTAMATRREKGDMSMALIDVAFAPRKLSPPWSRLQA